MKKIISFVWLMLIATLTFAQTGSEHLTFKGIPIDGSLDSFIKKIEQTGLTYMTTYNNHAIFKGSFSGYYDCHIFATASEKTNCVTSVSVNFPYADSWIVLSSNYFRIKDLLTTKYGQPSECKETFDAYAQPNDDQMRMLYVNSDKCKYATEYTTSKGLIKLVISHITADYEDRSYVTLIYIDFINNNEAQSKAIDDL